MKRFLLVMLSLGLVLAFSASAMAVDVKFSGSYYAAGLYQDKVTLKDTTSDTYSTTSTAFYYQRLRVQTDFIVSPGLKLVTRFDALERIWGGMRSTAQAAGTSCVGNGAAAGCDKSSLETRTESENIAFDVAYVEYISPIGLFRVGYMAPGGGSTVFGNSELNGAPVAKIVYGVPIGPVTIGASMEQTQDTSYSYNSTQEATDRDYQKYSLGAVYNVNKNIEAGLGFEYRRVAVTKANGSANGFEIAGWAPYYAQTYAISPYAKAKFGPVAVEAEFAYAWGQGEWEADTNTAKWDSAKIENFGAYLNVMADFKMVYVGATFAYVSGDDPGTTDKIEGGLLKGGKDFSPTLILFNWDRTYWVGALNGYSYGSGTPRVYPNNMYLFGAGNLNADNEMINTWFFQGKVGARPIAAMDINFAVSFANADKKPPGVLANAYGWEFDLTGTYKITNNLSYMLGAGYLLTGDYFQGSSDQNNVNNNYLLINKLTLTF